MMLIKQYIKELLYVHECVTIPSFGAFLTHSNKASVDYEVALPFAIANMIGGYLAPRYVLKYGYTMLRPMFLIVSAVLILTQIISFIY